MSAVNAVALLAAAGGDYQISRSVRLRSSASAYLDRTFTTPTSRRIFTLSAWAKRGALGGTAAILGNAGTREVIGFFGSTSGNGDALHFRDTTGGAYEVTTTAVFRDPSAWYHIVVAFDTTQATASNRVKMYVNGVQQTSFAVASYPSQNTDLNLNSAVIHAIGRRGDGASYYLDGYLTEINFIDGQALTPSSFGETDAITGVWKPKKYAGTYGTNGFYLNFSDNSSNTATTIGKDNSGNGNNWTPNNISVTAGVTYDSMLDVPTLYADGGNGRGNYCVLNPLNSIGSAYHTVFGGNLNWQTNTSVGGGATNGTKNSFDGIPSTGLWYHEFAINSISPSNTGYLYFAVANAYIWWVYGSVYQIVGSNGTTSIGLASAGDVIQVAVNSTTGKVWFGRNGTWYTVSGTPDPAAGTGATSSFTPSNDSVGWTIEGRTGSSVQEVSFNFGQRHFAYTPPTGFKALNTQNLPEPVIKKGNQWFDVSLWTGNGTSQSIVNSGGFQPDLVWEKCRNFAYWNELNDSVRGAGYDLYTNTTNAEDYASTRLTSFNSNGFSIGSSVGWNESGRPYVGWQWKESVSAGFDIVTYTGTGANLNVNHSLGVAPSMIIVKRRDAVGAWDVYHKALGATGAVFLHQTNAFTVTSAYWNNTAPSSSSFTLAGTNGDVNVNGSTNVAYLFAEVAGFSKFSLYTGNGSTDGPFVFCGFRPRFVMIKCSSAVEQWAIKDTARNPNNTNNAQLFANASDAEDVNNTYHMIDFNSNGFKIRGAAQNLVNGNGQTYIFMAFAESPFKHSLAR